MTPSRSCVLGQLAALAVVSSACSSSSPPGGSDGNGSPVVDGPPPAGLFPLRAATSGGTLVTDDGKPFLLHGEAAWSLIAALNATQVTQYLTDRHNRGVNLVLVNLIEHFYANGHAPRNAAGVAPFSNLSDFTTTNEAYFAFADGVIDLAASLGIAVLLTPSYLGFDGGEQGWYALMQGMSTAKCTAYGKFLGQRYASRHNIIWLWGGDFTPPNGSPGELCMRAIRDAIQAAQPDALTSGHWAEGTTSLDESNFADAVDLVGVYTYAPAQTLCRMARSQTPRKPTYLLETRYEGENGAVGEPSNIRREQWAGILGCSAGEISGNGHIWQFDSQWSGQLGSPVSVAEQRLANIVQRTAWQTLAPDDALVTSGGGGRDSETEVIAASTSDVTQALIYIPNGGGPITVNLGRMAGPVTATWHDPTSDNSSTIDGVLSGSHVFTVPGSNAGKNTDWVLMLTAQ